MKTFTAKDRKHVGELLKLFEKIEVELETENPVPFYRKLIKHHDKSIDILRKNKHNGDSVNILENERNKTYELLSRHLGQRFLIHLRDLKINLERGRDS